MSTTCYLPNEAINDWTLKAKFHYASWFKAGSMLVADKFEAGRRPVFEPVCDQLRTSFEPANQLA